MLGSCVDEFGHASCSDYKEKNWCYIPAIKANCCETCEENGKKREVTINNNIRLTYR